MKKRVRGKGESFKVKKTRKQFWESEGWLASGEAQQIPKKRRRGGDLRSRGWIGGEKETTREGWVR